MRVRECYTEILRDENGVPFEFCGERWIELPYVITAEQAIAGEQWADEINAANAARQAKRDQMADLERQGMAAFMDGDTALFDKIKADRLAIKAA